MAVNADAFTVSAIILLIVGAICFYLFTRIKQTEKKLALMEGILLDLKTATEAAFLDFPAPTEEEEEEEEEESTHNDLGFLPVLPEAETLIADSYVEEETPITEQSEEMVRHVELKEEVASVTDSVQVNKLEQSNDLESLSVADLATIARNKGITGTGKMRKNQLITAIKEHVAPLPEQPLEVDGVIANSTLLDSGSLMASPL